MTEYSSDGTNLKITEIGENCEGTIRDVAVHKLNEMCGNFHYT